MNINKLYKTKQPHHGLGTNRQFDDGTDGSATRTTAGCQREHCSNSRNCRTSGIGLDGNDYQGIQEQTVFVCGGGHFDFWKFLGPDALVQEINK